MDALKATGLAHAYGKGAARTDVLKDFELALAPGAFEALMGPSGSGKSTFLHLAAGLIAPSAGRIEILVGAGVDASAVKDLAPVTGCTAFQRTCHVGHTVKFALFGIHLCRSTGEEALVHLLDTSYDYFVNLLGLIRMENNLHVLPALEGNSLHTDITYYYLWILNLSGNVEITIKVGCCSYLSALHNNRGANDRFSIF